MGRSALQIGQVAASSGVSIDTVRYYERRGLIKRASRSGGGFRLFSPEAVGRILFIKQAQELGFSLDEIRELLTNGDGVAECRRVRDLLRDKLAEVDERMKKMREFRRTLQQNLEACEREIKEHGGEAHCPVIVNIERGNKTAVQEESYEKA
jgi:MerR family transcriptional regulator, copper efflux regulator